MKKIAFFPTPNFIVKKMIELSNTKKDKIILDTGFGEGAFIYELEKQNYKNINGIEYSTKFYNKGLKKYIKSKLFHDDYLNFNPQKKYDSIIGNPPYINSDNLDFSVKENIRKITQSGEGNIYYAFIIKSIQLLKEEGTLTYIVPYDFFYNTFASYLRKYMIENGYFTDIIDLGESKIFKNADPETVIFKYIKNTKIKQKHFIKVSKIKTNFNLKQIKKDYNNIFNIFDIENFTDNDIWALSKIKKIEGKKLSEISDIKVSVGIVNGAEYAFHLNSEDLKLISSIEQQKYVKGFIKNKNRESNLICKNFENYIWIPLNEFKTEKELKEKSPSIYKHLLKYKKQMLKRKLSKNKNWYEYLAIRNLGVFENSKNQLKIHVPSLTRMEKDWFFLSKNNKYVGGDLITITSKNENLLLKIFNYLNSKNFIEYYKERGAKKGKRIVFTQKIISNIIIPLDIISKV